MKPFALLGLAWLGLALSLSLSLIVGAAQAGTCQNDAPPSNPDNIYKVHGDGTVTDERTGLMWKQCAEGQNWDGSTCTGNATGMNWAAALKAAESAVYVGHDDWRLPNLKELFSLVEECTDSPTINDTVFPGTPGSEAADIFWSGSAHASGSGQSWGVTFWPGLIGPLPRDSNYFVRLVRTWQPLPELSDVALSGTPTNSSAHFVGTSDQDGTGWWLVVPKGSVAPTSAQVKAGVSYGGVTPVAQGSAAMTADTPASFDVTGLSAATDYDFYLVVAAGGLFNAPQPPSVAFSTATPIDGVCGSAGGVAQASEPVENLCSAGTATAVEGTGGQWQWGCNGSNGGTSTNACTAAYASQTLTISASPSSIFVGGISAISASSDAGLSVSLAGNAHCTVSGSTATGTNAGTCTITASQPGTDDTGTERYLPAPDATVSITVNALPTYAIHAVAEPSEGGTVICEPVPVEHGGSSSCTATASEGYTFDSFSGACSGSTCDLNEVTEAKSVTGQFAQSSISLVLPEGPWTGEALSVSPSHVNGWVLDSASTATLDSVAVALPSGWQAPYGVVNLRLSQGAAGTQATVVLSYPHKLPAGTRYYKYGPTTDDATPHWYAFDAAVISGSTITLTLTDGANGDDDLSANGQIADPGAPVVPAGVAPAQVTAIPTLSQWVVWLLAGLLGLFGLGALRRPAGACH